MDRESGSQQLSYLSLYNIVDGIVHTAYGVIIIAISELRWLLVRLHIISM